MSMFDLKSGHPIREQLEDIILGNLTGYVVDNELEHDGLQLCIDKALQVYRRYSSNSLEECIIAFTLRKGQQNYTLPDEIVDVQKAYRQITARGMGFANAMGYSMSPGFFGPMNLYRIDGAGSAGGFSGILTTYESYSEYIKLAGKMMGSELAIIWTPQTHNIYISENIRCDEEILLHVWKDLTDEQIITDRYSADWIQDYATAHAKELCGLARRKFGDSGLGPDGQTKFDGASLIQEANEKKKELVQEIRSASEGSYPSPIIIG